MCPGENEHSQLCRFADAITFARDLDAATGCESAVDGETAHLFG